MEVTIQEVKVTQPSKWGPVEKQHGLSRVLVGGELAGYVPVDGKYAKVFHPLDTFPREHDSAVVKASGGTLTRSIRDKKKAANEQPVAEAGRQKTQP